MSIELIQRFEFETDDLDILCTMLRAFLPTHFRPYHTYANPESARKSGTLGVTHYVYDFSFEDGSWDYRVGKPRKPRYLHACTIYGYKRERERKPSPDRPIPDVCSDDRDYGRIVDHVRSLLSSYSLSDLESLENPYEDNDGSSGLGYRLELASSGKLNVALCYIHYGK
jgi:hypothetical protein